MTKELTSKQIIELIDIASITFARWQRQGLIPPPDVRPVPAGRGKRGYWPEWVVDRCKQIKQLRKAGHSLTQIKQELGDDWEAESEAYRAKSKRRYKFDEASRSISMRHCAETLGDAIKGLVQQFNKKHAVPISPEHVRIALELAIDGMNPVLVVNGTESRVTADFVITDYLANNFSAERAFLVIPLFEELQAHLSISDKIPKKPRIRASSKLLDQGRRKRKELRFWRYNGWDFEIRPEEIKKKSSNR